MPVILFASAPRFRTKYLVSGWTLAKMLPRPIEKFKQRETEMKNVFIMLQALIVAAILMLLVACGGAQHSRDITGPPPAAKLAKTYDTILFSTFTATPEISRDYPEAARELQHSMMTALKLQDRFDKVDMYSPELVLRGNALIVKSEIVELRIVHGAARFWGGAMAGSSGVEVEQQLIDAASGQVLHQEKKSSWNNAWGAAWSGSDNSILDDTGKILAQELVAIIPLP